MTRNDRGTGRSLVSKQLGMPKITRIVLAVAMVASIMAGVVAAPVAAQVSGTIYTSPNYGYSVSWELPWYVTEMETDANGFDVLGLADSQSFVYFSGGQTAGDPAQVISRYADQLASDPSSSGFAPVEDLACAAGGDGVSVAASCYRFDITGADGAPRALGLMLKAWDLGNGLDVLLEAYTDEALLSSFVPHWHAFQVFAPGAAVPTPDANTCQTETIHGVSYCMDPALTERDRGDIVEGVRLGQDTIAAYFGNPDLGTIQITGLQGVSPFGDGLLATTRDRSIAVYAGSEVWDGVAPVERIETLVHEFFHIYQNVMTEDSDAQVPLWFTEGAAEAVGFQAASQLGVTDQAEFYALTSYSLTTNPFNGTLADLETADSMGADAYPLAYVAVQYLLGSKGMSVSALGDVYGQLRDGASFDDAFTNVFGVTPDQFSAEFEAWRPSLQQVNDLPDDFYPATDQAPASPVTFGVVPQTVGPDQQLIVTAITGAFASCDATLQLGMRPLETDNYADQALATLEQQLGGTETIERTTFANGEGNVFWLFSIPPYTAAAAAKVTVDCGGGPESAYINVM